MSPQALLFFGIYIAGSLLFGERFPFSRYDMYADVATRDRGAIPLFLADGQWTGLVALVPLALGAWVEAAYLPSGVHHGKLVPMVVMLGWCLGGREAAAGNAAAVYALAAFAKIWASGMTWFSSDNLGLLMVERSVGAPEVLAMLRIWLATNPALCQVLAAGAWLAEAAGIFLLWPRFRFPMAIVLTMLHLGIFSGDGLFLSELGAHDLDVDLGGGNMR